MHDDILMIEYVIPKLVSQLIIGCRAVKSRCNQYFDNGMRVALKDMP
jgi:hypothetical protein